MEQTAVLELIVKDTIVIELVDSFIDTISAHAYGLIYHEKMVQDEALTSTIECAEVLAKNAVIKRAAQMGWNEEITQILTTMTVDAANDYVYDIVGSVANEINMEPNCEQSE